MARTKIATSSIKTARAINAQADRPRRQRRSAAELTAKILDAARSEFDQHGPNGATTAAIARRAGVTEAQLFRYFPNKAALFREAVFGALNTHFAAFQAAQQPFTLDDRAAAKRYIAELTAFLRSNRQLMLALLASQAFASDPSASEPIAALSAYFDAGAAMRSKRTGDPTRDGPERQDHKLAVRVSFAAALGAVMFHDWLFPADLASPVEIEVALTDFILDGVSEA